MRMPCSFKMKKSEDFESLRVVSDGWLAKVNCLKLMVIGPLQVARCLDSVLFVYTESTRSVDPMLSQEV